MQCATPEALQTTRLPNPYAIEFQLGIIAFWPLIVSILEEFTYSGT